MRPVFIVKLVNGKTDDIFEYDFKNGQFIGRAGSYGYKDIQHFIGLPVEIISSIFESKRQAKKPVVEFE